MHCHGARLASLIPFPTLLSLQFKSTHPATKWNWNGKRKAELNGRIRLYWDLLSHRSNYNKAVPTTVRRNVAHLYSNLDTKTHSPGSRGARQGIQFKLLFNVLCSHTHTRLHPQQTNPKGRLENCLKVHLIWVKRRPFSKLLQRNKPNGQRAELFVQRFRLTICSPLPPCDKYIYILLNSHTYSINSD